MGGDMQRVLAVLALLGLFPLLFLFALGIQLRSRGPVFFKQQRVGFGGRIIKLWKLRTMVTNAEEVLQELVRRDARIREEWDAFGCLAKDPRIAGPFGQWARRYSIDEVPQLINVILGEMNLIGPRPILLHQRALFDQHALDLRHSVRPGMTGLWQVCGRSEVTLKQMLRFDLIYVRQRSFLLDCYISLKTLPAVLGGRGAV